MVLKLLWVAREERIRCSNGYMLVNTHTSIMEGHLLCFLASLVQILENFGAHLIDAKLPKQLLVSKCYKTVKCVVNFLSFLKTLHLSVQENIGNMYFFKGPGGWKM